MVFALLTNKAKTHTQNIAFPQQKWLLREFDCILRYMYIGSHV